MTWQYYCNEAKEMHCTIMNERIECKPGASLQTLFGVSHPCAMTCHQNYLFKGNYGSRPLIYSPTLNKGRVFSNFSRVCSNQIFWQAKTGPKTKLLDWWLDINKETKKQRNSN